MKRRTYRIDGKYIWIPTDSVPFGGLERGDYIELSTGGYKRRIPNNFFTRFHYCHLEGLRYLAFCLGFLAPVSLVMIGGALFNLHQIIYMPIAAGVLIFQMYYLSLND